MRGFGKRFQDQGLLFITDTVWNWINIFRIGIFAEIVMNSLKYCIINNWFDLYAYVLMPNHLHLIIKLKKNHKIEQILRDFNKFTSQQIILMMKEKNHKLLNNFLIKSKKQKHKIWMGNSDVENIISSKFLLQKANYIHNNPLQPKWQRILKIDKAEEYPYSSARYYFKNIPDKYITLTDLRCLI